jgi:hypothetical protein
VQDSSGVVFGARPHRRYVQGREPTRRMSHTFDSGAPITQDEREQARA